MSSDLTVITERRTRERLRARRLHEWVTTVDHKRLGLLYILYALFFLVIGGIEATIMRFQLMRPHNDLVSPQVFNRMFTMHGTTMIFFVAMPIAVRVRELSRAADDRRARHGVPAPQCLQLLDDRARRPPSVFQLSRRQRPVRRGQRARRRLVRVCAADREDLLAGHSTDYWTLSLLSPASAASERRSISSPRSSACAARA